ncbi:MAG: flagellar export protein FliJ [Gammaproteobacteria bacterium]|nr:flagellar export protein FliJ [Gammaproteobacteria bacterium]
MKQSRRLEPICHFNRKKEEDAAKALAKASQEMQLQKQRLLDLENYRGEYAKQFAMAGGAGLNAARMREYQTFMANLSKAIEQQKSAIHVHEQQFEERKRQWLAARSRSKALETVKDRYLQQENNQEEKRLQKEIDDRSSRTIKY